VVKLLIWIAAVVAVLLWLQHVRKARLRSRPPPRQPAGDAVETMVRCAECGVHLPVSEALVDPSGASFCCEEHRARHR
jgi:uncharacterized protein